MHLLDSELKNGAQWEAAGIQLPEFDREAMKAATRECPQWIHFGAVSYTHLDVYKRQITDCATRRPSVILKG